MSNSIAAEAKVARFIADRKLLSVNKLYIVALSGGSDSVALLLLLKEMGYDIHAAHCNFHLRGEESDRDERFCKQLCSDKDIPFHVVHFDTTAYSQVHHVSIEMAARELRYRWFEQLRQDIGAEGICVAHHMNDSVETVLINLLRGTGLRGLGGIKPENGKILRPLLVLSKEEILAYLNDKNQEYVTDSTNLETDVVRNKIRLTLMPIINSINPGAMGNILHTSELLAESQAVLDEMVDARLSDERIYDKKNNTLNISLLNNENERKLVAFEWLKDYGFNGKNIEKILEAKTGAVFVSKTGYELLVNRGQLIVEKSDDGIQEHRIPETGNYRFSSFALNIKEGAPYISKIPNIATFDADRVSFPLILRHVKPGDSMVPYGMKQKKLLSDIMINRKMSVFDKRRQLVITDGSGNIMWAVGLRVDARFAVTQSTKKVVEIAIS